MRVGVAGHGVAARAAATLLTHLGFDVTRYAAPSSGPGVGQGRVAATPTTAELLTDRLHAVLGGDAGAPLDLSAEDALARLVDYDVVICDVSALTPAQVGRYKSEVGRRNQAVWVSVSPFGLTGPDGGRPGNDLTIVAAGGLLEHMRGSTGRPVKPAGAQSSLVGGHFAAMAAMHGLLARRDGHGPIHLDVSLQETVVVTGVFLEAAHRLFDLPGAGGSARYAPPRGLVPCADGSVYIVVLEDHQWDGLVTAMGSPGWARGLKTVADRKASADTVVAEFGRWAASMTSRECMERLQANGVPCTRVSSVQDLADDPGLIARGFFEADERTGERRPRLPYTATTWPTGERSTDRLGPIAEPSPGHRFRVLDATHVLAGPLAMSWLGTMGVDVVKLEDVARPDVYRRRGPFPGGVPDLETSAYFAACNYSKRSYAIDSSVSDPSARISRLAAQADAVVENFGTHRARRYGLLPETLWAGEFGDRRLRHIVSSSGFGKGSPYEAFRVYGQNVHAYGGLLWLTRDEHGLMTNMGTSWADPLAAVWMACVTLARVLFPLAAPVVTELSMVEVVAYEFPEFFSLLTRDGLTATGQHNEIAGAYPSGVYRCREEDQWIAISIESDEQWRAFADVVAEPGLATGDFGRWETRRLRRAELDPVLDKICARWPAPELLAALLSAAVTCARVATPQDLVDDAHLIGRGFFGRVTHARWGEGMLPGLPWTVLEDGRPSLTATPLIGEHTEDVEHEWLPSVALARGS